MTFWGGYRPEHLINDTIPQIAHNKEIVIL